MTSDLRNGYIKERVGSTTYEIYARKGPRYIDGKRLYSLDLANITSSTPGKGSFPALVQRAREIAGRFHYHGIYIESILNSRLEAKLLQLGFRQVNEQYGTVNYYIEGDLHEGIVPARKSE